ncbi:7-dehydrocholesterol reductase-like [Penaeus chinensis]|uniref:7-dehydrocholesterol reductase-like n=1 Tax=Penaeus chinensis TaxID=139456 RepID=UPI001FB67313|nr:7-dehydrocholesterol reductase-like [Penaeus chinensis]XP_047470930.1 7-dehydrocholesterol reductase-like [Penaeus chinensis]
MTPYDVLRYYVGPPLLMVSTTVGVQALALVGGDGTQNWSLLGSNYSWTVVLGLLVWALFSLWIPGKEFLGPTTQLGYTPRYKANGFQFFLLSLTVFLALLFYRPVTAVELAENMPQILASCNILAMLLCVYLLVMGKVSPQTNEFLESRPILYEFYRGMEVHPRLLGVDVKQLTNCRFGLLAWELLVVAFFVAGWIKHGFSLAHLSCATLQTIYLGKFYWWETGYFDTLDITLDRAGYYICWGCLVFVPAFYTYSSYYLVAHPPLVSNSAGILILLLGIVFIALNYRVDWEKEYFRAHKGKCYIWGYQATFINATYESSSGIRQSKLLTSGFWGIARHLNYVFEILAAFSWSLPGFGYGIWPFLYCLFLTVLLVHRVFRDEEKCRVKYGAAWVKYSKVVPYRMIPGVF